MELRRPSLHASGVPEVWGQTRRIKGRVVLLACQACGRQILQDDGAKRLHSTEPTRESFGLLSQQREFRWTRHGLWWLQQGITHFYSDTVLFNVSVHLGPARLGRQWLACYPAPTLVLHRQFQGEIGQSSWSIDFSFQTDHCGGNWWFLVDGENWKGWSTCAWYLLGRRRWWMDKNPTHCLSWWRCSPFRLLESAERPWQPWRREWYVFPLDFSFQELSFWKLKFT